MEFDSVALISLALSEHHGGRYLDNQEDREAVAMWILDFMEDAYVAPKKPIATFTHPDPPPSANKIYFVRGSRKILTATAGAWKNRFVTNRGGLTVRELMDLDLGVEDQLHLEIWVYLEPAEILNLGYGKNKATKYPYAKVDTSNFIKLAEDSATALLGISCDRQNFDISAHKRVADDRGRRIVMHLYRSEMADDPMDRDVPDG